MPDSALAIDPTRLRQAAGQATGVLKALSHEDRLLLLCELSRGEACVGDLQARLGIVQPSLSQQLGVLRAEGLVATRREGKRIHYRVADAAVLEILAVLVRLYCPEE